MIRKYVKEVFVDYRGFVEEDRREGEVDRNDVYVLVFLSLPSKKDFD